MGGFSFDMGFQRMWCKRLQGKTLGLKIRTSEVPTIYIDLFLDKRGVFNLFFYFKKKKKKTINV